MIDIRERFQNQMKRRGWYIDNEAEPPKWSNVVNTYKRPEVERGALLDDMESARFHAACGVYLIRSLIRGGWWGKNSAGYPREVINAGHYTFEEASAICREARDGWKPLENHKPTELAVPLVTIFRREDLEQVFA
ncbi:MAG: hypothetical protein COA62_15930 [Rhodobiaceae bacterium]|nr:MAG: hypothetical protein COA62_15930 [Rhodobiaceae bacterium]